MNFEPGFLKEAVLMPALRALRSGAQAALHGKGTVSLSELATNAASKTLGRAGLQATNVLPNMGYGALAGGLMGGLGTGDLSGAAMGAMGGAAMGGMGSISAKGQPSRQKTKTVKTSSVDFTPGFMQRIDLNFLKTAAPNIGQNMFMGGLMGAIPGAALGYATTPEDNYQLSFEGGMPGIKRTGNSGLMGALKGGLMGGIAGAGLGAGHRAYNALGARAGTAAEAAAKTQAEAAALNKVQKSGKNQPKTKKSPAKETIVPEGGSQATPQYVEVSPGDFRPAKQQSGKDTSKGSATKGYRPGAHSAAPQGAAPQGAPIHPNAIDPEGLGRGFVDKLHRENTAKGRLQTQVQDPTSQRRAYQSPAEEFEAWGKGLVDRYFPGKKRGPQPIPVGKEEIAKAASSRFAPGFLKNASGINDTFPGTEQGAIEAKRDKDRVYLIPGATAYAPANSKKGQNPPGNNMGPQVVAGLK